MINIIKVRLYLLLFIFLPCFTFSQQLSTKSAQVKTAWEALNKQSGSKQRQLAYLDIFPANNQQFMAVFQPEDFKQLYHECNKYIDSFAGLAKEYPKRVIDKSINIAIDLKWEADATGRLQHSIVEIGISNITIFLKKIKALPATQSRRLIEFLADEEGIKHDHPYQELINALTKIGEKALANKFIDARSQRGMVKE